jgi:hypothetical protein
VRILQLFTEFDTPARNVHIPEHTHYTHDSVPIASSENLQNESNYSEVKRI